MHLHKTHKTFSLSFGTLVCN